MSFPLQGACSLEPRQWHQVHCSILTCCACCKCIVAWLWAHKQQHNTDHLSCNAWCYTTSVWRDGLACSSASAVRHIHTPPSTMPKQHQSTNQCSRKIAHTSVTCSVLLATSAKRCYQAAQAPHFRCLFLHFLLLLLLLASLCAYFRALLAFIFVFIRCLW